MDKPADFVSVTAGLGWIDDSPRVVIYSTARNGGATYLPTDSARFLAMQILMAANEIDREEHSDDK